MKNAKSHPYYTRDCKSCGCPLSLRLTHDGKMVPLDLWSPVYCVVGGREAVLTELAFVSHFATCPDASKFSKKKTE